MKEKLAYLTSRLIQFDTTEKSLTGNSENSCLDYLSNYLSNLGFRSKIVDSVNRKSQIIQHIYAEKITNIDNKTLVFLGHYDVVEPGDLSEWQFDPFSGHIDEEFVHGRGAVDMKGAIAAFLEASKFTESNVNLIIILTGDEETESSGIHEILRILEDKKLDFCIVGEPTSINKICDNIKIGRRGSFHAYLTIFGKQGHVAYPEHAINPILTSSYIINNLYNLHLDEGNEYFDPSNLEVTNLEVDNHTENLIPNSLKMRLNIRYNNLQNVETMTNHIKNICSKHVKDFYIETKISAEPFLTNGSVYVENLVKIVKKQTGSKPLLTTGGGTSEARFLAKIVNTAEMGLRNHLAHKINEKVAIHDLEILYNTYANLIKFMENK